MGAKAKIPFFYSPGWMVLVGLVVRILCIVVGHTYRFDTAHWRIWEMANIASSVALGHGFSSPFGGDTGPSAWTAPLYPWVISLAFRAFGVYSYGAAFAMLVFNSIFSALTSWTIYRIARRTFNETIAVWSGWTWALFPYTIFYSVTWIWETSLSAFLLSLLFMLTLEMECDDRPWSWVGYGLLWAIAALTNTSLIAWLPFSGCWLAYQLHRHGKRFVIPATLSALVFWAALAPWLMRNYSVFGKFIFVRGDLGVELRSANNPVANGEFIRNYHPGSNGFLYAQYAQMGEASFVAEQGDLAKEWIVQHPKRFLVVSFLRFIFFWAGLPRTGLEQLKNLLFLGSSLLAIGGLLLAARRHVHGAFLFATLLGFYPLIYYLTFPTPRYRHAIDPELAILAVFLISCSASLPSRRLLNVRGVAMAFVAFLLMAAFALINNNFSLTHVSHAAFEARLDNSLDQGIAWIAAHPEVSGTNPPLMYMVADIAKMTNDPRLPPVLHVNVQTLHDRYARMLLNPFWERFDNPAVRLPFLAPYQLRGQAPDQRWFAYGIAPDKVTLSDEDMENLFSLTKYVWGARHHQILALIMYRDFNGRSPKVDETLNQLVEKDARDQTYDFRVTDAYIQRNAFILAAGRPDLIRSRWIDRILENQTGDGSWKYCWFGWGRGVLEFGTIYPGHTTIQAVWALTQLKYRYPQWIAEHYH
jgi:Dolichyl-phosphate-mannose-protein mannosyltransferase